MNRLKLVIVEDDHFTRKAYEEKFRKLNKYDFTIVADGALAIDIIKRENPDLVLLDIVLPGIDGFQVLKELKADSQTKNISVVVLSNLGQEKDVEKGLSLGADDYLIKSDISIKSIESKIDSVLLAKINNNNKEGYGDIE